MTIRRLTTLAAMTALLAAASSAVADDCTARKLKAHSKYESKVIICHSTASLKGPSFDLHGCEEKALIAFNKAMGKTGTCPGLPVVCESTADDCMEAVTAAVADTVPNKCVAAKRKAAAKLMAAKLTCYAKSAKGDVPVVADCLTKAETKFANALTKAGACADGGALQALVTDSCVLPSVTLDGSQVVTGVCPDVDECLEGTDDCDVNATCANTPGSFTCTCNVGYSGDGATCTEIDECVAGTDNCSADASCTNSPGSFSCLCNVGFTGDGVSCTDIDECAAATDNCDANATCSNTPGSFSCVCNPGYGGDGVTCGVLLTCPCWNTQSAETLAAALELGAGLASKTCTAGPDPYQADISAESIPYNSATVASIYTSDDPNPVNACCAYVQGSPAGCVPYLSDTVVGQCRDEIVALMPLVSWCPH